jgi:hypothetical protein
MLVTKEQLKNIEDPEKEIIYEFLKGGNRGITVFEGDTTVFLRRQTENVIEFHKDIPIEQWKKDIEDCKCEFQVVLVLREKDEDDTINGYQDYNMNFRDNGESLIVLSKANTLIKKYFPKYNVDSLFFKLPNYERLKKL